MPKKTAKKAASKTKAGPKKKAKKSLAGKTTSVVEPGQNVKVEDDDAESSDTDPAKLESNETAPAIDPDIAERDSRMKDRLLVLSDHGIVITQQQYLCLSDENIRLTNRWVETLRQGLSSPPPVGLMAFATDAMRERLYPSRDVGLPPRKFMGCEFGNVSIGDQTASIPVKVDADRFKPDEAHNFLCGRRVEALIVLEDNSDRDQGTLFDEDDPPRVDTICDIKSYRGSVNDWAFKLTFQLQEISIAALGQFAHRSGRCELQLLGDAKGDDDSNKSKPNQTTLPHPDVEMGKNKPHGTPALDALAQVRQEQSSESESEEEFGDGIEESPATIPFTGGNSEKLSLGLPQLTATLKLVKADMVPLADLFHTWSDEMRGEIDIWAKVLTAHAAGDTSIELPPVPDCLKPHLPQELIDQPIGFVRAYGPKNALLWHCQMCDERWSAGKPRVCSGCAAKGDDVVLIGFYGDPNVTFEGIFIGPDVEEYLVLPEQANFHVAVRVAHGEDSRWRAALHLECVPADGDPERINDWPTVRDAGRASENDSIAAVIGKLIDRWQPLTCELREPAVTALKEYLSRIESGQNPLEIEQALPDAEENVTF